MDQYIDEMVEKSREQALIHYHEEQERLAHEHHCEEQRAAGNSQYMTSDDYEQEDAACERYLQEMMEEKKEELKEMLYEDASCVSPVGTPRRKATSVDEGPKSTWPSWSFWRKSLIFEHILSEKPEMLVMLKDLLKKPNLTTAEADSLDGILEYIIEEEMTTYAPDPSDYL